MCTKPALWIQIHWIWIRIKEFGPIWLDPDLGPDPGLYRYTINFERKKKKENYRKTIFFKNSVFKKTINQMLPKEMFTQLSLFIVNLPYILNPGLWICIHFLGIQIQHFFWMQIWIRIQKVKWMKIHVDLDPAKQTL